MRFSFIRLSPTSPTSVEKPSSFAGVLIFFYHISFDTRGPVPHNFSTSHISVRSEPIHLSPSVERCCELIIHHLRGKRPSLSGWQNEKMMVGLLMLRVLDVNQQRMERAGSAIEHEVSRLSKRIFVWTVKRKCREHGNHSELALVVPLDYTRKSTLFRIAENRRRYYLSTSVINLWETFGEDSPTFGGRPTWLGKLEDNGRK